MENWSAKMKKGKKPANMIFYPAINERKRGISLPFIPKDKKPKESQKRYYTNKIVQAQAATIYAKMQFEIDEITLSLVDIEQKLPSARNANKGRRSLKEEFAYLQSERKAKGKR